MFFIYGCVFLFLVDMSYCMTYDFFSYVFDFLMSILLLWHVTHFISYMPLYMHEYVSM